MHQCFPVTLHILAFQAAEGEPHLAVQDTEGDPHILASDVSKGDSDILTLRVT